MIPAPEPAPRLTPERIALIRSIASEHTHEVLDELDAVTAERDAMQGLAAIEAQNADRYHQRAERAEARIAKALPDVRDRMETIERRAPLQDDGTCPDCCGEWGKGFETHDGDCEYRFLKTLAAALRGEDGTP